MARANNNNKYTALNFNEIYEQKAKNHRRSSSFSSSSSSNSSSSSIGNKTILSNSRIHGNMLVLSLPSSKPVNTPPLSQPSPRLSPPVQPPVQTGDDDISLRPLGRTGSGPALGQNKGLPVLSPRSSKFVPPHLRPGFQGKEEKPAVEFRSNLRQGLGCDGEEGMMDSGVGFNRSRSIGSTRPSSSG
ncbi:hypothetical protein OSB04_014298 [Centaurea solstitialis]|uniref:Uncharacterized protein n=1 Tax=Centaurea solstitialis TaxID=347529 RepID=A0AA38TGN7_9ASTR|nr:hypothetical protein OSB04_014298 [Centaurea solstitialis]